MKFTKAHFLAIALAAAGHSNVGGTFLSHGLSGLNLGSKGVLSAVTRLNCENPRCTFVTNYRTNAPNSVFIGRFYGARVDSLVANGVRMNEYDSLRSDSILFGRKNVLHDFGESGILRFPLQCAVGSDSLITITGKIRQDSASVWGLGFLRRMSDLRHLYLASRNIKVPTFSTGYILAPIDSFSTLEYVRVYWNINGYDSVNRSIIFASSDFGGFECESDAFCLDSLRANADRGDYRSRQFSEYGSMAAANDSVAFSGVIPDAIVLKYSKPLSDFAKFGWGGPIAFVGRYDDAFSWSAGWELAINLPKGLSLYPSASISQYNGVVTPEGWLRLGLFPGVVGVGINAKKEFMWRAGIDLYGPIGFEASEKSILLKGSL